MREIRAAAIDGNEPPANAVLSYEGSNESQFTDRAIIGRTSAKTVWSSPRSGRRRFSGDSPRCDRRNVPQERKRTLLLVAIRVKEIPLLAYQFSDAVFEYPFPE